MKKIIVGNLHLYHPRPNRNFFVYTDASDHAIGGVLYQEDPEEGLRVITYENRTLKEPERRYCTSEKEILAVVYTLSSSITLCGTHFDLHSNNQSLSSILCGVLYQGDPEQGLRVRYVNLLNLH